MDVSTRERGVFLFGPFRLDPVRRTLMRDGVQVSLAPRLFDTLLHLVANHERLVEKGELLAAVWGRRNVEEANLSQAIFALRKVLQAGGGEDTIVVTAPGRGYRCGVPVVFEAAPLATSASVSGLSAATPDDSGRPLWRRPAGQPVAALALALALALAGAVLWQLASGIESPPNTKAAPFAPPAHSVAVLAFTNLSGDPGQDYMSDGISEEVIDALDRLGKFQVAARISSFAFKGRQTPLSDIARQLNVGAVLEGSVRSDGKRVRVVTQLINTATGFQLWSRHYDRVQGDVLTMQEDIAQAVASALKVSLRDEDVAKLNLGGTANSRAMDAYLRGMHLMDGLDRREFPLALDAFNEATAADPNFALAYSGRAMAQSDIAYDMGSPVSSPAKDMRYMALASAKRAIALSPQLPEAHSALAGVLEANFFDPAGALVEAGRAVALEPDNLSGEARLAETLMETGQSTASVAVARRMTEAEPLLPDVWEVYAYVLYNARRYSEAMDALGHTKALSEKLSPMAVGVLTLLELVAGDPKAAAANCMGSSKGVRQNMCLAIAYHALGRLKDAQEQLAAAQSAANYTPYVGALIFAQWGETDRALDALQAAFAARDPKLIEMKVDPLLDPIRHTQRFADIARQLDF